jgi:iron complex outermembrane receptor protein
VVVGNTLNGRSSGIDVTAAVQPRPWWRMRAGYSYLTTEITADAGSRDVTQGVNEYNDPRHLFSLRGAFDISRTVELDAWLRYVGALPNPAVPAYTELNARAGWQVSPRLELALIGQDLLHGQHPEFGTSVPRRIEFERSLRALLTVRLPN